MRMNTPDLTRGDRRDAPGDAPNAVLAELRKVSGLLVSILAAVQRQDRPSRLSRDDRRRLAAALPAISGVLGSDYFTSCELLEWNSAALRIVLADLNAKKLGGLLRRAEGVAIDGLTVARAGRETGAVLWQILAT
jgi:hypothetical protein